MTDEKIKEVLSVYRKKFEELNTPKKKYSHNFIPLNPNDFLSHCHAMLEEIEIFLKEDRREKVFRWLGFIQGCLWRGSVYTVEELKNHNRPGNIP